MKTVLHNINRTIFLRPPLFLAVLLFIISGCRKEEPVRPSGVVVPVGPDQIYVDARFVVTENGATNAIVRADSINVFQKENISVANGHLQVDFFSRQGEQISTLTADRGIVYGMAESIDSLRAEGDVVITWNKRNAKMETPFIRWIATTRMVYADSSVVLSVENGVERGVGFAAPDDLSSYTMGRVTGIIEDQKIEIPGR
ncbi:MAG: LPS export ABC transporter periplasmic protein LptC, partial [Candidatus Latescibacterota bacterium]